MANCLPWASRRLQSRAMRWIAWFVSLAIVGTDASAQPKAQSQQPGSWELRDNRWEQVNSPGTVSGATTQPMADPVLEQAEQLLERRDHRAALKVLVPWIKTQQASPLYDRGLFLMAEALYQRGDRIRSFY